MNNLKKVLALGLALVMLLGMFTVVSAAEDKKTASDLTDWNTVVHKDAVSLMVDLGIIKGMPDGSFAPAGNIDRASWAKMVYFAATGSEDADAYLGTATGLGDIAGNWAESYISFLKANNYISGDNYGNYNPSNNVTVAEACKMMLTVLGYDAEDRGYQNDAAWSGKIMNDAKRNGLMDNVDKAQTALVPLTRENAAEIVLNALNANMVEGIPQWDNGNRYITTYGKLHTLGYDVFNMIKVTATVTGFDPNGFATFAGAKVTDKLPWSIESNLAGKIKADAKLVGEEVNVYVKADGAKWDGDGEQSVNGSFTSVISTTAAQADSTPVKVITSGITRWNDLTTRGTSNFVATNWPGDDPDMKNGDDTLATYYYNGAESDITTVKNAAAKRGTVVEFYLDANGKIGTVKAYGYTVAQVTNGDASTKTLSDGTVQVRVPGVVNGWVDSDKITGWQGLVEDDVVLFYKTNLGTGVDAYTIEKAEKVTGKVDNYTTGGTLTIAGKTYRGSEQTGSGTIGDVIFDAVDLTHTTDAQGVFGSWNSSYNQVDEYDFYLDKNGSIIAAVQLTESMDSSKVAMVLETEVLDKALGVSGNLRANLLFVDGTTAIVNIAKVGVNVDDKVVMKNVVDTVTNEDRQISTDAAEAAIKGEGALTKFFSWRSTSSGYELSELNAANYVRNWENPASLGDGTAKVATIMKEGSFAKTPGTSAGGNANNLSGWTITANNNTTFVVGKRNNNDDTVAYSVYKGFRNVPVMDANMISAICANTSNDAEKDVNTVAKYVYLETGAFKDDVPDGYVFIYSADMSSDRELSDDGVMLVKIVDTDGKLTTMRVDSTLADLIAGDTNNRKLSDPRDYVGKFFAIGEIDENGVVYSLTDGAETPTANREVELADLTQIGDGTIQIDGSDSYDYDSATKFIYVDMGWTDGDDNDNTLNVREPALDFIEFKDAGNFLPNGFYNVNTVNAENNDNGEEFISVRAVVVCPANSTTADYVYVLRTLW